MYDFDDGGKRRCTIAHKTTKQMFSASQWDICVNLQFVI